MEATVGDFGKKREYIHNYARTSQGRIGIQSESFRERILSWRPVDDEANARWIASEIFANTWHLTRIINRLSRETPETRGKLAECGLGQDMDSDINECKGVRMSDIGADSVELTMSGRRLLQHIALYAVIAAMADNIWDDLKRRNAEALHHSEYRDELPERKS